MSVISAVSVNPSGVELSTNQSGVGDSTNTVDRQYTLGGAGLLRIVTISTGTKPKVTFDVLGSMDTTTFFNVQYLTPGTSDEWTALPITIADTATSHFILRPQMPWRFLKLNYTESVNMKTTAHIFLAWV